jgi:hypothetical protein
MYYVLHKFPIIGQPDSATEIIEFELLKDAEHHKYIVDRARATEGTISVVLNKLELEALQNKIRWVLS